MAEMSKNCIFAAIHKDEKMMTFMQKMASDIISRSP